MKIGIKVEYDYTIPLEAGELTPTLIQQVKENILENVTDLLCSLVHEDGTAWEIDGSGRVVEACIDLELTSD